MDDTEDLEWCGPSGHHHPEFGELVPGQRYPVREDAVEFFLSQQDFWKRPGAPVPVPVTEDE